MAYAANKEQKAQKRQTIVEAATRLFEKRGYGEVNILDIATEAQVAKGTVYLYFKTKEAIFLSVYMQLAVQWFDDIDALLSEPDKMLTEDAFAEACCTAITARPLVLRLTAILHVVLEANIDPESALVLKRFFLDRITDTGRKIETRFPYLQKGDGADLMLRIYALIIGIEHLASPAPIVKEVIRNHKMSIFQIDRQNILRTTIYDLLQGLRARRARQTPSPRE